MVQREVLLLLGGNVGDPVVALGQAERLLGVRAGQVLARSRDHWTLPWGFTDDRLFLNRALLLSTTRPPDELLGEVLAIETTLGRRRIAGVRYGARTIDIDVLLIGGSVVNTPGLEVPHPRMHERAFALAPAADIAPGWVHPVLGRTVLQLLNDRLQPPVGA